jgi:hypothetical protein
MISTAENINATRMAKQQTRAKITMHFCCDWKRKKGKKHKWDYHHSGNSRLDNSSKFLGQFFGTH